MGAHTRLGCSLWTWEPFTSLPTSDAKLLWLALYTTAEAKRIVPGLFHGSIVAMADAARMPADDVVNALDKLLERELVEYDRGLRVLRLTELPDAGESPANGNVLRGWFRKWKTVPACAVRDAHVTTLRWIMDEWCRDNAKALSPDHEKAWAETFGLVKIPAPRKRGVRRLLGRTAQPGLFDDRGTEDVEDPPAGSGFTPSLPSSPTAAEARSARPDTVPSTGSLPSSETIPGSSLPIPGSSPDLNDSAGPETVPQTVPGTVRERSGSGSGLGSGSSFFLGPDPLTDLPGDHVRRPHLTLVPAITPQVDPVDLREAEFALAEIAIAACRNPGHVGRVQDEAQLALCARITQLRGSLVGAPEFALVGKAIARGEVTIPVQGDRAYALCTWMLTPGRFEAALELALAHKQREDQALAERQAALAEARKNLGYQKP